MELVIYTFVYLFVNIFFYLILLQKTKSGGRVKTDQINGYLLDRGFQVFIESYPESQTLFNYEDLNLKKFLPGAYVRYNGDFHTVSDPFRRPLDLYASLISPIGSLVDKVKVGIFSILIRFKALDEIFEGADENTRLHLSSSLRLSDNMIDRFFSPFYQVSFIYLFLYEILLEFNLNVYILYV